TEIVAFEFMLSRVSGRMARALATHRGLAAPALEWFTHHSEVDVRHAEQGLADLGAYAAYYEFTDDEALTIVEMTLRENVFARRRSRPAAGRSPPGSRHLPTGDVPGRGTRPERRSRRAGAGHARLCASPRRPPDGERVAAEADAGDVQRRRHRWIGRARRPAR